MIGPDREPTELAHVRTASELVGALDQLRRRAARGSGRPRVTLHEISSATGVPRSTVHAYVQGARLPPADVLDAIVVMLGAGAREQSQWSDALERVHADHATGSTSDRASDVVPSERVPRQLPASPEHFHGRLAEVSRLDETLVEPRSASRVVAVSGAGGIGKTALVLRWAWSVIDAFPDGQLWVDLRGFSAGPALRPEDALERLLRAVGVGTTDLPADPEVRAALFRTAVSGRRMLLVLDNAQDSAQVQLLLPASPGFVTVITSRDTLRSLVATVGATRVQVPRLTAVDAQTVLSADLPGEVVDVLRSARVVEQCDGLPLALRIVRERVSEVTAQEASEVVAELGRGRAERLAALDLNDASTEVSVSGVLRISYAALPPDAARVFRRLGLCLVSTFEARIVAALADRDLASTRRALDTLMAANLLDRAGGGAYRVHDLVATFADERLAAEEGAVELADARARLQQYVGLAADAAIERLDPDRGFRIPHVMLSEVAGAAGQAVDHFDDPAAALKWITANDDLLVALVDDMMSSDFSGNAFAMVERAWRVRYGIGDVSGLEAALARGGGIAEQRGDLRASMSMARMLGVTRGRASRWQEAMAAFARSRALAVSVGDPMMEALDRGNIGTVQALLGHLDDAQDNFEAAIELITELDGNTVHQLSMITALAELMLERGDLAASRAWIDKGLPLLAERAVSTMALEILMFSARCDLESGNLGQAGEQLARLDELCRATGSGEMLSRTCTMMSALHRGRGSLVSAEAAAVEGLDVARALGIKRLELEASAEMGSTLLRAGRVTRARTVLGDALALARSTQLPFRECDLGIRSADAARVAGDDAAASRLTADAMDIARRCGYRGLAARAQALLDDIEQRPA